MPVTYSIQLLLFHSLFSPLPEEDGEEGGEGEEGEGEWEGLPSPSVGNRLLSLNLSPRMKKVQSQLYEWNENS